LLFLYHVCPNRHLHSFPTRRSSDLTIAEPTTELTAGNCVVCTGVMCGPTEESAGPLVLSEADPTDPVTSAPVLLIKSKYPKNAYHLLQPTRKPRGLMLTDLVSDYSLCLRMLTNTIC